MRVFSFTPGHYTNQYQERGYLHIAGGVDPVFFSYVMSRAQTLLDEGTTIDSWNVPGKKRQMLLDHSDDWTWLAHAFDCVAEVTGLQRAELTLSERHIKSYDALADPNPLPHKDLAASEVSVGIPLHVSKGSHLYLYPNDRLDMNTTGSARQYRNGLDEKDLPENALKNVVPVEIHDQPGDVVMFRGHSIWHERRNAAGTTVLYLKMNSMRLDPLGEDPSTLAQRDRSMRLLRSISDEDLPKLFVEVSPRLDGLNRGYALGMWRDVVEATVGEPGGVDLSKEKLKLVKAIAGRMRIDALLEALDVQEPRRRVYHSILRRLCRLQVVDFLESPDRFAPPTTGTRASLRTASSF